MNINTGTQSLFGTSLTNFRLLVVLIIFSLLNTGLAFAGYPLVRNFSKFSYKAGTQNWDIVQHNNDWMYFANNSGLLEFDGLNWNVYPIQNQTPVRSVFCDLEQDRIYAGASDEFGYYTRNSQGEFQYVSISGVGMKKNFRFAEVWKIHKWKNKHVFQADYYVFIEQNGKLQTLSFGDKITKSEIVNNQLIVAGINKGIYTYNGTTMTALPNADELKGKKICAILPYSSNNILFVTDLYGVYLYSNQKLHKFKLDIDAFLKNNQVFCAAYKNDFLAFGTVQNGLVVKNLKTNSTVFSNKYTGLQNNTILSIAFDKQNNIWLGLDKGIDYVTVNAQTTDLIGNSNALGTGYTSIQFQQKIFLGSNQGLYAMNAKDLYTNKSATVNAVSSIKGQVWSLSQIDNTLFCCSDAGVFVYGNTSFQPIKGVRGVWSLQPLPKHPNTLLGNTYNGFFVLRKRDGKWVYSNEIKGFNESANSFCVDSSGFIWMAQSAKGVYRLQMNNKLTQFTEVMHYDQTKGLPFLRSNALFYHQHQLIVSTNQGFYQYHTPTNRMIPSSMYNALFGTNMHAARLFVSPKGNIWAASDNQFKVAYRIGQQSYRVDSSSFFSLKSKLIPEFEHISFLANERAIISTENGFSLSDTARILQRQNKSTVVFNSIVLVNEHDSLYSSYFSAQSKQLKPRFKYKYNSLKFEYVCPEYRNENAVTYSYKLEGLDTKWSDFSNKNTKEYSKLPFGNYTFKVKAKNIYSDNIEEIHFQFSIAPPWYLSSIAIVFYILLLVLFLYFLLWYIRYRTRKAALDMEQKKQHEMNEQRKQFLAQAKEKENEIIALRNHELQYKLRHKSQDLASSTMNLIRKNEILLKINHTLNKIEAELNTNADKKTIGKAIKHIQEEINANIQNDNNWSKFQENFDLVYEDYLKRLTDSYPNLSAGDKKLCAYLKMDLSSKDIAPLMNTTFQSVEMHRHRLRKKLELTRDQNLAEFLQKF